MYKDLTVLSEGFCLYRVYDQLRILSCLFNHQVIKRRKINTQLNLYLDFSFNTHSR
jgi:hypothetical protein